MQTDIVQVADVIWPKPGKKNGTIKGADGQMYSAAPALLQPIQRGVMYSINYKINNFNGMQFKMVEQIVPMQGGMVQQPMGVTPPQTITGNLPQSQPQQTPAPQSYAKPAGSYAAISDRERSEQIFVCGALNNMLANPTRDPFAIRGDELRQTVNMLRQVYANTFGGVQRNDTLEDEIPETFR